MFNRLFPALFIVCACSFLSGCNSGDKTWSAKDTMISSQHDAGAGEQNSGAGELVLFTPANAAFEESGNHIQFHGFLHVENTSGNKITTLKMKSFLKLEFTDGETRYIPTPISTNYSDEDMANSLLTVEPVVTAEERISVSNPLKPGETKKLEFIIPGDRDRSSINDLRRSYFERTPTKVSLVLSYKAITIDGESEQLIQFDLIEACKQFQTELGLR